MCGCGQVKVFISDFHQARMQAAMDWVLELDPSHDRDLFGYEINSVSSVGIKWESPADFQERVFHEAKGTDFIRGMKLQGVARNILDLETYLLLGGHKGYHKFTHGTYVASQGFGWGSEHASGQSDLMPLASALPEPAFCSFFKH